jgi:6-methylsalicylate decarboxylase
LADRVDIRQHIWTQPLLEALGRRDVPPFARPANGRFVLYAAGETPATVEAGPDALESRLTELERDGVNHAIVALSCPIGIESLPCREAEPLLSAYATGVSELPSGVLARHSVSYAEELYPL